MIVLGIETSCDETAAAVVDDTRRVLGEALLAQMEDHRAYGGVVPEIAARAHLRHVDRVVAEAMAQAGLGFADLDAVAATTGPGLIGGVMVGAMTGKAIALAHDLPFVAVNHLAGHALTARFTDDLPYPYLLLLVSGGHCQILVVEGVEKFVRLGTTIDDAAGEAFDKVAKMLGLGYPGGPAVERAAAQGDPARFAFPRPLLGRPGCDFSFSGLKTAVRQQIEALPEGSLVDQDVRDICAGFQTALADTISDRLARGIARFREDWPTGRHLVVAGGVAANTALRTRLETLATETGLQFVAPPQRLCTDNGVMIAWAGLERFRMGHRDALDTKARPRWPLDPDAPPATGAGVKA